YRGFVFLTAPQDCTTQQRSQDCANSSANRSEIRAIRCPKGCTASSTGSCSSYSRTSHATGISQPPLDSSALEAMSLITLPCSKNVWRIGRQGGKCRPHPAITELPAHWCVCCAGTVRDGPVDLSQCLIDAR